MGAVERFIAELEQERLRPLFRIEPLAAESFGLVENHGRWQLVRRALPMLLFGAYGGTLVGIGLVEIGPVTLIPSSPFLLAFGLFALHRLTRRHFLFDLRTKHLEVRRKAGRFTVWKKRYSLAGCDQVHFLPWRANGILSHRVSLRGHMEYVTLLESNRGEDSADFALWLGRELGVPVKGIPEDGS